MNEWIMMDQKAGRLVKMGRVEPFDGMVSVLTREHDLGGYASINGLLLTCEYYYMRGRRCHGVFFIVHLLGT